MGGSGDAKASGDVRTRGAGKRMGAKAEGCSEEFGL